MKRARGKERRQARCRRSTDRGPALRRAVGEGAREPRLEARDRREAAGPGDDRACAGREGLRSSGERASSGRTAPGWGRAAAGGSAARGGRRWAGRPGDEGTRGGPQTGPERAVAPTGGWTRIQKWDTVPARTEGRRRTTRSRSVHDARAAGVRPLTRPRPLGSSGDGRGVTSSPVTHTLSVCRPHPSPRRWQMERQLRLLALSERLFLGPRSEGGVRRLHPLPPTLPPRRGLTPPVLRSRPRRSPGSGRGPEAQGTEGACGAPSRITVSAKGFAESWAWLPGQKKKMPHPPSPARPATTTRSSTILDQFRVWGDGGGDECRHLNSMCEARLGRTYVTRIHHEFPVREFRVLFH